MGPRLGGGVAGFDCPPGVAPSVVSTGGVADAVSFTSVSAPRAPGSDSLLTGPDSVELEPATRPLRGGAAGRAGMMPPEPSAAGSRGGCAPTPVEPGGGAADPSFEAGEPAVGLYPTTSGAVAATTPNAAVEKIAKDAAVTARRRAGLVAPSAVRRRRGGAESVCLSVTGGRSAATVPRPPPPVRGR